MLLISNNIKKFKRHGYCQQLNAVTVHVYCSISYGPASLSVTSRCSSEMATRRMRQTMPYDTPGTVVF